MQYRLPITNYRLVCNRLTIYGKRATRFSVVCTIYGRKFITIARISAIVDGDARPSARGIEPTVAVMVEVVHEPLRRRERDRRIVRTDCVYILFCERSKDKKD